MPNFTSELDALNAIYQLLLETREPTHGVKIGGQWHLREDASINSGTRREMMALAEVQRQWALPQEEVEVAELPA